MPTEINHSRKSWLCIGKTAEFLLKLHESKFEMEASSSTFWTILSLFTLSCCSFHRFPLISFENFSKIRLNCLGVSPIRVLKKSKRSSKFLILNVKIDSR